MSTHYGDPMHLIDRRSSIIHPFFSLAAALAVLLAAAPAPAADSPAAAIKVEWSGVDLAGQSVKAPAGDRPCVFLFVMANQEQSRDAIQQAQKVLGAAQGLLVVAVVSGQDAATHAQALVKETQWKFQAVSDPDYAASGKMSVHVWPTTVVLAADGKVLAHLAGITPSFTHDLEAYAEAARGRLDEAALAKRLSTHAVVADGPSQKAGRHMELGQRLLDKGMAEEAREQFTQGLAINPQDMQLRLALTRALLLLSKPEEAMARLATVDAAATPAWRLNMLRGWALLEQGKWPEARAALVEGVKLNPQPSEAYYLLGLIYLHDKDAEHAAEAFRHAYESTPAGRQLNAAVR